MNYFIIPGLKKEYMEFRRILKKDFIIENICDHFGIDKHEINSRRRFPKLTHARYIAYMFLYKYTGMSKTEIGNEFGLDHSSVIHGMKVMKDRMETKDNIMDDYAQIESKIINQPNEIAA